MKQSIGLVVLQIISIIVGFLITFYIAGVLSAKVYAVLGVYSVITSSVSVFSNVGLETYAGRNVLFWNNSGSLRRTRMIITQAIVTRTVMAVILSIIFLGYAFGMSKYKFDGMYFSLFCGMCFCSIFQALNDSLCLLLKAFNKYLLAALSTYSINVFGRVLALILFIKFGFYAYVYCVLVLPIIVSIPLVIIMWKWFDFKYIMHFSSIKSNILQTKFYTISAYLNYGAKSLDVFLVSVFLKPEILATYSLVKRMGSIIDGFLSNLFDPLLQKLVAYKKDIDGWRSRFRRILTLQKIIFGLAVLGCFLAFYFVDYFIKIMNLGHYPYIKIYLLCMLVAEVLLILYKVKYMAIMLFYSPKQIFVTYVVTTIALLGTFVLIQFFPEKYLYVYMIGSYILICFYTFFRVPSISCIEKNLIENLNN